MLLIFFLRFSLNKRSFQLTSHTNFLYCSNVFITIHAGDVSSYFIGEDVHFGFRNILMLVRMSIQDRCTRLNLFTQLKWPIIPVGIPCKGNAGLAVIARWIKAEGDVISWSSSLSLVVVRCVKVEVIARFAVEKVLMREGRPGPGSAVGRARVVHGAMSPSGASPIVHRAHWWVTCVDHRVVLILNKNTIHSLLHW